MGKGVSEAPPGAAKYDHTNCGSFQVGDVGLQRLKEIDIKRVELVRPVQRQPADTATVGAEGEIIH